MESSQSRTFAQFGGALLLVSLVLPWFALSLAGLGSHGFRVWTIDKGGFVLVAAYGLLALSQIRLSDRDTLALIYLIVGVLMTAAFVYKIWISPPGSAKLEIPGAAGTAASGVSVGDVLKAFGLELKPTYGAYVAMLGSVFFTVGAFLEFREAGAAKTAAPPAWQQAMAPPAAPVPQQAVPAGQRYVAPAAAAQAYAPPAQPAAVAPDPFAVPQQQPALPPQQPAAPPNPYPTQQQQAG